MHWLAFCINFMGLISCYRNPRHLDAKSLKQTFWKLIIYAKLPAQLKERSSSNELQRLYLILLCMVISASMQFRPVYYLVSYQVSMQQASKIIVKNFPMIKMSNVLFSNNTQLVTRKINYSATHHLELLRANNQYTQLN